MIDGLTIICDLCGKAQEVPECAVPDGTMIVSGQTLTGETERRVTAVLVWAELRGWTLTSEGSDLCPKCARYGELFDRRGFN
jgi:hypothetical protein